MCVFLKKQVSGPHIYGLNNWAIFIAIFVSHINGPYIQLAYTCPKYGTYTWPMFPVYTYGNTCMVWAVVTWLSALLFEYARIDQL